MKTEEININKEEQFQPEGVTSNDTPEPETEVKPQTSQKKPLPKWLWTVVAGIALIVLLAVNINSCSKVNALEKAGIENGKKIEALEKKSKGLENDLSETKAMLNGLEDLYQDSLDQVRNPEWFRYVEEQIEKSNSAEDAEGGTK